MKAAFGAGFDRFSAVDNATASLESFAYTQEQVTSILGSANQAALGTAFSYGDLASAASAAVASGVQQGTALTKYLGLVTDAAAATHASVSDISVVFNQVTAAGRAYTQDMNQIVQRGIPVWRLLAAQYGVNTTQIRKMVSEGKVDSETFFKAIDKYIGGSAKKVHSLAASWSNTMAAIGRAGAGSSGKDGLLGPILEESKTGLKDLTSALNAVQPSLDAIGKAFGDAAKFAGQIPAPVLAGAAALGLFTIAGLRTRSATVQVRDSFGNLREEVVKTTALRDWSAGIRGRAADVAFEVRHAAGTFRSLRDEAALAGATLPAVRAGLTGIATAARAGGSELLNAFGGPVMLGITAGVTILTAAIAAWQAKTAEQKQTLAELTATLDENTGAVTANTYQKIAEDIGDVIKGMNDAGVSTSGLAKAIAEGGPELDKFRDKLLAIIAAEKTTNARGQFTISKAGLQARDWLNQINDQAKSTADSIAAKKRQLDATGEALDATADKVKNAAYEVDGLDDKLKSVFSDVTSAEKAQKAIDSLSKSIVDNGKSMDESTAGGVENAAALTDAIDALAAKAGGDSTKFQGSLMGMLAGLKASGVDTTKVMSLVKDAFFAVTDQKWSVLLDGSQSIAAAQQITEANLTAAESALTLQEASAGDGAIERSTANAGRARVSDLRARLDELKAAAQAAKDIESTFAASFSTAASNASEKASAAASTADKKATQAQKDRTDKFRDQIEDLVATAKDGTYKSVAAIQSMAKKQKRAISDAYSDKDITKKEKTALDKLVDKWKSSSKTAAKAAADAAADLDTALKSTLPDGSDLSVLSSDAQQTLAKIDKAVKAGAITAAKAKALKEQVSTVDVHSQADTKWADAWGKNGYVDGVNMTARDIIAGADAARAKIAADFKAGLISKDARKDALDSINQTVVDLQEAGVEARKSIADAAKSWGDGIGLDDDALRRIGRLSAAAQDVADQVLDTFNQGGIDAGTRDGLLAYIRQQDDALHVQVDRTWTVGDELARAQAGVSAAVLANLDPQTRAEYLRGLTQQNSALSAAATQTEIIADTLAKAQDALSQAVSDKASFRQSIIDGLISLGDVTAALKDKQGQIVRQWTEMRDGKAVTFQDALDGSLGTTDDIKKNLRDRIAAAVQFRQDLAALQAEGLDAASYKQVVNEFVENGSSATAQALLAGGAGAVQEIAGLQSQLADAASGLADAASSGAYDVSIAFGQGIVKGLQDQQDALNAVAAQMGEAMLASIKASLGIASPSKKARAAFSWFGIGGALGLKDSTPAAVAAAADMADQVLTAASVSPNALLLASDAAQPRWEPSSSAAGYGSQSGGTTVQLINRTGVRLSDLIDVRINDALIDFDNDGTVAGW
ncbi:tape measure protein [Galbitalea sp. SE-J8]|uniref:tape measure protein n=1 Tax=Galbitalea sp. SE-J8 TaxID=3054952 RepID=UPI00259CCB34|nr:tape measure protein [Galbitalea sp. SE-J8]MDM4761880.1 tape measure protein [Galbitalea sp. SE-J8]